MWNLCVCVHLHSVGIETNMEEKGDRFLIVKNISVVRKGWPLRRRGSEVQNTGRETARRKSLWIVMGKGPHNTWKF